MRLHVRDVRRRGRRVAAWAALLFAAGCASAPLVRGPDESVQAADPAEPTRIERRLDRLAEGHGGDESGFRLLSGGEDALIARLAITNLAERSIDVQSYIWRLDGTGRLVISRLIAAADRGVRVRILLDDTAIHGEEAAWLAIDSHPNLSVRAFNPFRSSTRRGLAQALEFAFDFSRLNRRMHVKSFTADAAAAIVGGRNIADDYYALDDVSDFRDLDLLCVGAAATEASRAFDDYWNSDWSFPIRQKRGGSAERGGLERYRAGLAAGELARFPYDFSLDPVEQERRLDFLRPGLVWAPGRLLWDPPAKVESDTGSVPGREIFRLASSAKESIALEMAYLIPPKAGIHLLRDLERRGVEIEILTNSLVSNDVVAAHAGYAKVRPDILATGTRLHEFRPRGDLGPLDRVERAPRSIARQHVKAGVIDARHVFVGSLNLDGRSLDYNTEVAVLVDSPELAIQVRAFFEKGFAPASSWLVVPRSELEPELRGRRAGRHPIWLQDPGTPEERVFRREPRAGFWRRLGARLIRALPIEGYL